MSALDRELAALRADSDGMDWQRQERIASSHAQDHLHPRDCGCADCRPTATDLREDDL